MKKLSILSIALFVIIAGVTSCKTQKTAEEKAPKIDLELFFKNSNKSNFQISPDGKYYSYLSSYKGMMNIFVKPVGGHDSLRVTADTLRSIRTYGWKGERIVYLQDVGGDENFQLFSVSATGSDLKALTPFKGVRTGILDDLRFVPGKENEMIVQINKRNKEYFDPYLLNIETGKLTVLFDNKENYDSWVTDHEGHIRIATKTDGVNVSYYYRDNEKAPFKLLLTTSFKESFAPQVFDAQNKNVYVLSNLGNRDKIALVEYDPAANKEVKEIFSVPDYDLDHIFYDEKNRVLVSAYWTSDKDEEHFFDEKWASWKKALDAKFPGYLTDYVTYNDSLTSAIAIVYSDRLPGKYYLQDFASGNITELANPRPWINEKDMAEMKPVRYYSRDSMLINGYLTLPKGVKAENLPVVVNPHGGPWARDIWRYNPEVQFLANRGYAVFQMNYRGSTGYGKQFFQSSFKQWGKKMQDDITDGVNYLIKQGIADPHKVAIYGGSYGGYATLAGITFTPDLYACAVDYVGVSNLFTFMNTIPPYWKPYLDQFHEMVGDPKKDSILMAEASPVFHADKIKVPLLIAQGANDPRVNKAESDQMVQALKSRGIEVEYLVKDNEGHGFLNENNRFDFYRAMEKFLDKNLAEKKDKM
jgi:dipeptidyl aminopeptidase/acylaminoacyl peptidase